MNIPIVTLDKIYITPDSKNIYFLDCTRVNGTNDIISRKKESLELQIINLGKILKGKSIILADDVVYSGSVLKNIINRFKSVDVSVVGVAASICSSNAYEYFNKNLKYGVKANFIISDNVIDQICERDFYFGIAGSGIMVKTANVLAKAPYFIPYGNPNERASIPKEKELIFSRGCMERSIYLWNEIDKLRLDKTKISELPEKIINTNPSDEVVKTLKKEMKKL